MTITERARVPSAGEKTALGVVVAGAAGTVPTSDGAGAVTMETPSVSDHAATHVTGGGDTIADAIAAGNSGLMSGADKTKLDGIDTGADVTADNPPQDHAATHVTGGGDTIADAIAAGNSGLMSGTDKTKLDAVTTANIPTAGEKTALGVVVAGAAGSVPFSNGAGAVVMGQVGTPTLIVGGDDFNYLEGTGTPTWFEKFGPTYANVTNAPTILRDTAVTDRNFCLNATNVIGWSRKSTQGASGVGYGCQRWGGLGYQRSAQKWAGQTMSFRLRGRATAASNLRAFIYDATNVVWTYSAYHSGGSAFEDMDVTYAVPANCVNLDFGYQQAASTIVWTGTWQANPGQPQAFVPGVIVMRPHVLQGEITNDKIINLQDTVAQTNTETDLDSSPANVPDGAIGMYGACAAKDTSVSGGETLNVKGKIGSSYYPTSDNGPNLNVANYYISQFYVIPLDSSHIIARSTTSPAAMDLHVRVWGWLVWM